MMRLVVIVQCSVRIAREDVQLMMDQQSTLDHDILMYKLTIPR